jgi:hypothetical protein
MHVRTECLPSQTRLEMLRLEAISFFIQRQKIPNRC